MIASVVVGVVQVGPALVQSYLIVLLHRFGLGSATLLVLDPLDKVVNDRRP
jgi:hypothetical protein